VRGNRIVRQAEQIHRLRATAICHDQLCKRLTETGIASRADATAKLLIDSLAERLLQEPAVKESAQLQDETIRLMDRVGRKK
jgi:hypothetical protein